MSSSAADPIKDLDDLIKDVNDIIGTREAISAGRCSTVRSIMARTGVGYQARNINTALIARVVAKPATTP